MSFLFLAKTPWVFAESKFAVTSDITYKIADNGVATVIQNYTITNQTTQYFPAEYITNLPQKEVYNLRAFDKSGTLKIETKINNDVRQVKIIFGEQIIGAGKQINWSLAYETPEIAKKNGRLWEVFIPRPPNLEGQSNFTVGLYPPTSFGKQVYIKPAPPLEDHIWQSSDLKGAGIFAVYDPNIGKETYQAYDFKLTYRLYNPKLYPAYVEIALPPDTARQKVFLAGLSPKPINVRADIDGNWLAKYQLGPAQHEEVIAQGSLAVFLVDRFEQKKGNMANYLLPQKFWDVDDPKIQEVSRKLKTTNDIYQFVVNNLRYDNQKKSKGVTRLGAKEILSNPMAATSLEFSDLFVALARSINIPTREVEGFAANALHSWPEYYDNIKEGWIPIDPTWARTTNGTDYYNVFDFNHIVLAIHAESSTFPQPAGINLKDIAINYHEGDLDFTLQPRFGIRTDVPPKITSGFNSSAKIFIENYGPTVFENETATMISQTFGFEDPSLATGSLLPFANKTLEFKILPLPWFQDKNDIINLEFERQNRTFEVSSRPFYRNNFILTISILFSLGLISIVAQITRSIYFFRQKRKSDLRGEGKKPSG